MNKTHWVVVADEAIARILQWPEVGDELEPVEELTDPDAHADGAELRRDAYGRRAGGGAQDAARAGPNVTSSAGTGELHKEAGDFARRVAGHLDEALRQGRFDTLRIVAAPRFLGLLRKALTPQVADTVALELDKDLVHASGRELTERLFPMSGGLAAPGVPRRG
ncbi:host attachment protein [Bordetella sp. 2513F-2]